MKSIFIWKNESKNKKNEQKNSNLPFWYQLQMIFSFLFHSFFKLFFKTNFANFGCRAKKRNKKFLLIENAFNVKRKNIEKKWETRRRKRKS